jgi:hypothetical protein
MLRTSSRLFHLPLVVPALLGGCLLNGQPSGVIPGGYIQTYPSAATMDKGTTLQLRAAVMNPVGFELPNKKVTWKSGNMAIALIDNTGLVTAVGAGSVTIHAKSGAAEGVVNLTIQAGVTPPPNTAPVVAITSPTDGATFPNAATITFTGTANDAEDGNLSSTIVWKSALTDDPDGASTTLGTGATIVTSSLAPGSYLVTASATDSGSLTGIAQIGVTVQNPCVLSTDLRPLGGQKLPQTLELISNGVDTCGRPLRYIWECTSATSGVCDAYNVNANNPDNQAITYVDILSLEDVTILVQVCAEGTNECSVPQQRVYFGAVTS